MAKNTQYTETRNLILVVSFNQPEGEMGRKYQPVVVECRAEAWTPEGAVRNVVNRMKIGEVTDTPLTNEEVYKAVYALSPVLAEVLKGTLLEGVSEDMSKVSVEGVKPTSITDTK